MCFIDLDTKLYDSVLTIESINELCKALVIICKNVMYTAIKMVYHCKKSITIAVFVKSMINILNHFQNILVAI